MRLKFENQLILKYEKALFHASNNPFFFYNQRYKCEFGVLKLSDFIENTTPPPLRVLSLVPKLNFARKDDAVAEATTECSSYLTMSQKHRQHSQKMLNAFGFFDLPIKKSGKLSVPLVFEQTRRHSRSLLSL